MWTIVQHDSPNHLELWLNQARRPVVGACDCDDALVRDRPDWHAGRRHWSPPLRSDHRGFSAFHCLSLAFHYLLTAFPGPSSTFPLPFRGLPLPSHRLSAVGARRGRRCGRARQPQADDGPAAPCHGNLPGAVRQRDARGRCRRRVCLRLRPEHCENTSDPPRMLPASSSAASSLVRQKDALRGELRGVLVGALRPG